MSKKIINNTKLGLFVIAGLLFLVMVLYMIGRNENLFGETYILKARFENVQGLVSGNNIRFSGINVGTIKKIKILSDSVIEVSMYIEKRMQSIIRKNAIASIGTEGIVGNRVVNITPAKQIAGLAQEDDILITKKIINTDEMLETLYKTNIDIGFIASELKTTVQNINTSNALWSLFNDKTIPQNIRLSVANIRTATARADKMINNLDAIVMDVKKGKGSVGALLTDTSLAHNLNAAVVKINSVGDEVNLLTAEINKTILGIRQDINTGTGTANALLKDSLLVKKLNVSLDNIQKGTDGFNQNMEAIKHSFLFRGYFKKMERLKQKEKPTVLLN
jgi:phospholipid/cholesterol/gamma-HCH transport system substrate-binding protein